MALLGRMELLKKEALKIKKVELDEERFIFVRQMNGREKDRFEQSLMKEVVGAKGQPDFERSFDDYRAKLVVNTVCDEEGNNILNPDDYETLSQNMSAATLDKIISVAQELNRIDESDKQAMVKNSSVVRRGGSILDSPKL